MSDDEAVLDDEQTQRENWGISDRELRARMSDEAVRLFADAMVERLNAAWWAGFWRAALVLTGGYVGGVVAHWVLT